jgi:cytochrome c biogenesis protein ResB
VNKPLSFLGWKIYQSAYEMSANRTKYMSVFDVVRDPWLPVVYAGAILMLIGTCHLFWNGVKRHGTAHKDNMP